MKLRTRLFGYFGLVVVLLGLVSAFVGVRFLLTQTIQRAQSQVRSDLNSAWSFLQAEMDQLETVLVLNADRSDFIDKFAAGEWDAASVRNQLELTRMHFDVDFLSIITSSGRVVVRGAPPYTSNDFFLSEPLIKQAFKNGEAITGITLMTPEQLDLEHGGLSQRAFLVREETPHARPGNMAAESRGMVLFSAVPVLDRNNVIAVLYGGILLNRNEKLVHKIEQSCFRNETYKGNAIGTVTLFLHDCRIATTVLRKNGQLALGTLVSKEVANQVLDNKKSWLGRAFVVNDWYLTAYDPICNFNNEVIGIFYVGILEKPFTDMVRALTVRYGAIIIAGAFLTLVIAFFLAGHLAKPLHALADAAERMVQGERTHVQSKQRYSSETKGLIRAFNTMTVELAEREEKLRRLNEALQTTNSNYMETLGFVSHELKTPLGSIMNYVYLLAEKKLGDLTDKQVAAVKNVDIHTKRITEMIRHYLNLSRIENNQLNPKPSKLRIREDILRPLLESSAVNLGAKKQNLINEIADDIVVMADYNMTFEVFENMLSNAIKYGDEGGTISLTTRKLNDMVVFHVRNTGPGIPLDKKEAVFEKFYRIDNEKSGKKQKGTGLGLFITRRIVEAHGGSIEVFSEPGQWVEFSFSLPKYEDNKTPSAGCTV